MKRIWELVLVVIGAALAAALARWAGLTAWSIAEALVAGVGLVTLYAILRYPWDLFMEARTLAVEQRESRARGIEVRDEDVGFAHRTARKLLLVCLTVHLGAAATAFAAARLSGDRMGDWFAAFYILSTVLRPAATLYRHLRTRLRELRRRARFPREDAVALRERVEDLEIRAKDLRQAMDDVSERGVELATELEAARRQIVTTRADYDARIDRVCREMTRSVEKLTDDRELLAGLRAFVRMVKDT